LATARLSYAGRLDPLAEGELLVLVDQECNEREKYLGFDKTYIVDVLFGVATDTGDVLGKIGKSKSGNPKDFTFLSGFVGTRTQIYPLYSSKRLNKNDDEVPTKEVTIYSINIEKVTQIDKDNFHKTVIEKIDLVRGDFRQAEIKDGWEKYFAHSSQDLFTVLTIKVYCSSGTYMRVLAEEIGKKIDMPALAFHIKREKIHMENR
jgi:tRNA pseudouridine55 synthase